MYFIDFNMNKGLTEPSSKGAVNPIEWLNYM